MIFIRIPENEKKFACKMNCFVLFIGIHSGLLQKEQITIINKS
jgi:hypothetical protein